MTSSGWRLLGKDKVLDQMRPKSASPPPSGDEEKCPGVVIALELLRCDGVAISGRLRRALAHVNFSVDFVRNLYRRFSRDVT
jgi:hypothetical protein